MTTHQGRCHCGRVAFEVEGQPESVLACNCSMCQRKGSLLWFVAREKLRLLTPEENASAYLFNKHAIRHRFCPTCGIHPYGEGNREKSQPGLLECVRPSQVSPLLGIFEYADNDVI